MVAFTASQLWAGLLPIAGVALLAGVPVPLPGWAARGLGVAALGAVAGYLAIAARGGRSIGLRGFSFPVPSLPLAAAQCAVSAADWTLAALVLHALLPGGLAALVPAAARPVRGRAGGGARLPGPGRPRRVRLDRARGAHPGGARPGGARRAWSPTGSSTTSARSCSRSACWSRTRSSSTGRGSAACSAGPTRRSRRWSRGSRPAGALVAGAVLLVSGATPAVAGRLHLLRRTLPLPVLEASHLARQPRRHGAAAARRARWRGASTPPGRSPLVLLARGRGRLARQGARLGGGARSSSACSAPCSRFTGSSTGRARSSERCVSGPWVLAVAVIARGLRVWIGLFATGTSSTRTTSGSASPSTPTRRASCARRWRGSRSSRSSASPCCSGRPPPSRTRPARPSWRGCGRSSTARPTRYAHLALRRRQAAPLLGRGRRLPDVRRRGPQLGGDGRPGRPGPGGHRAGLALPRALRPARRLGLLLPGRPGRAAALPRPRALPAQARRGGARAARGVLARGERAPRRCGRRTTAPSATGSRFEVAPPGGGGGAAPRAEAASPRRGSPRSACGRRASRSARSTRATSPRVRSRSSRRDGRGRRVRQRVDQLGPGGALGRPDALSPRRAAARPWTSCSCRSCSGEAPQGYRQFNLGMAPFSGLRGARARAALDAARRAASSGTARTSTTSRGCARTRRSSQPEWRPR